MRWEFGEDLFASPLSPIYLDINDGQDGNCQGGVNDDAENGVISACIEEWRFVNLQGDGKRAGPHSEERRPYFMPKSVLFLVRGGFLSSPPLH